MNIDNFIFSELKITASENLHIEDDLTVAQNQPISEIFNEKNIAKTNQKETNQQTITTEAEDTK
jgi:hypothetical protein